ncbi:ABC transporter permease [Adhaeribacter aquaticus]|uniref:ABC transporter permease n=1 Tax=Adhaeribacter aquaticus TaxID=299567 RepID=UPI000416B81E|nr:FtsX-like permease family protein [Adhaeribacter aquaticus]
MNNDPTLYSRPLNLSWLFKMAWRDSRRNRSRLFLFISSIILGIAALVAIYSFGYNLRQDIDNQAKSLLGADLAIYSNQAIKPEAKPLLDSIGPTKSEERSFASMVYFIKNQGTRLVQIRALSGAYPYYGGIETTPVQAAQNFRRHQNALVDKTLMLQYNAQIGDSIKVGELTFKIAGILNKAPDQSGLSATVAPAVYIPLQYLDQTGLTKKGSRINYKFYYQLDAGTNIKKLVKQLDARLEREGFSYETIESKKENTGKSFEDLTRFLTLVGFIALLLGCIGVASAIHIYVREKLPSIAVLRCLGVKASQTFLIYLIQILGIGLIGSIIGAALGTVVQRVLPIVLQDFLPIQITMATSWYAIMQGIALGVLISLLFALLPLVSVRNISPLNTLRISYEETSSRQDPLKWAIFVLIFLFILGFSWIQMETWLQAVWFTGGVVLAFLFLAGVAYALMWAVKKFFPSSWSYLWRQGIANLHRPNNQTLILIVAIGLGTAFICTLYSIQNILVNQVSLSAGKNQPNMVLFDIQSTQKEQIVALTRKNQLPILQQVPVVTMRLEEINGRNGTQILQDTASEISKRAFTREYRVTYRDTLTDSEKITAGKWRGTVTTSSDTVYISLDEGFAHRIHVKVGDQLLFNVQGALIKTVVGSFRKIEWRRVQTNFLVIFPAGVLEEAPQFHVLMTRVPTNQASARFQQALVQGFPNISVIDLGLILSTLDEILKKIAFIIRFMAGFSISTGLVVLIASVLISKYQRIQESVLLRTLGANRRQIFAITTLEYFFLGALAAGTGILIAVAASWALAKYIFEAPFTPSWVPTFVLFGVVTSLTIIIGLINSRGILNRPPLEILRSEV